MLDGLLWLVIPTYNEADSLPVLLARVFKAMPGISVLIVDDNSPDGTGQLVEKLRKQYSQLHILHRAGKLGIGSAYQEGFAYVLSRGAEVVIQMDADLSHQPEDIPRLVQAIEGGAEVVIGSRRIKGGKIIGWGPHRHLMSWSAGTLGRLLLGLKIKDITAGFRVYTKKAMQAVPWNKIKSNGYAWLEEVLYLCNKADLKIVEVPVVFEDRKSGKSKLGGKSIVEFFLTIFRLRFGG